MLNRWLNTVYVAVVCFAWGHIAFCDPPPPVPKVTPSSSKAAVAALAPEHLSSVGLTPEQYAFKQEVYQLHVQRGEKSGRPRIYDLPASELTVVEGTEILMRSDAAGALDKLLKAANSDLAHDRTMLGKTADETDQHARALQVERLGISNAYRSASTQFAIWDRNFQRYLGATEERRRALPGGEYGAQAAVLLRDYIGVRVAAPGYSNHQGGIAVDFVLFFKPDVSDASGVKELTASTVQTDLWRESWFWHWLDLRAGKFDFRAYLPEPWHWEYVPRRSGKACD